MSKELPEVETVDLVGPGSLLSKARIQSGLSIDDVANRLNFRVTLVKNIEADTFDKTLPDTYNRGYLKNYAKLVNVSILEVIGMYEKLNVYQDNSIKMQSFSRGTMKKAENSILMWITYLILAIFVGLTVMWWIQDDNPLDPQKPTQLTSNVAPESTNTLTESIELDNKVVAEVFSPNTVDEHVAAIIEAPLNNEVIVTPVESSSENLAETTNVDTDNLVISEIVEQQESTLTKVIFTFVGDCWVNIHDALGDRIAWGIKKSGYVMTINAKTPLKITIGKPELVNINFGGETVDMSLFPQGHIAKFDLPLLPQS